MKIIGYRHCTQSAAGVGEIINLKYESISRHRGRYAISDNNLTTRLYANLYNLTVVTVVCRNNLNL